VLPVVLGQPGRAPQLKTRFVYRGTGDPFGFTPRFAAASGPPPLLESTAPGLAAANLEPDADGLVPGMAAEVLRLLAGKTDITVTSNEHDPLSFLGGIGIASLETPQAHVPAGKDGRVWLRYARQAELRQLDPKSLTTSSLKGAVVVVGLQGRNVQTPLGPASAASVMADTIENLMGNTALVRPGWARLAEALFLAVAGAALVFLLRSPLLWGAGLVLLSTALVAVASWYLYLAHGVLIDWATPALFLGASFGFAALLRLYDHQLTYAKLRAAFANSLPRASLDKIARNPGLLKPEGEWRAVTYLACATRMESAPPGLQQKILNTLIDQALAQGGTLDRVSADGFALFWNAPLEDADHARHACEAANGLAALAAEMARNEQQAGLEIGVGIATGEAILSMAAPAMASRARRLCWRNASDRWPIAMARRCWLRRRPRNCRSAMPRCWKSTPSPRQPATPGFTP